MKKILILSGTRLKTVNAGKMKFACTNSAWIATQTLLLLKGPEYYHQYPVRLILNNLQEP